jgi:predicted transcriptional regulator YdeE
MEQAVAVKEEIKLVGTSVRTSYTIEQAMENGKIYPCVMGYFQSAIFDKIPHRKTPGTTYCVYTDYESDYRGAYTYFIGEEVTAFDEDMDSELKTMIIPQQSYAKFTTKPLPMPEVVVESWKKIWAMSSSDLGGGRRYDADFEVYDERAADHDNIVLDLYVGVE